MLTAAQATKPRLESQSVRPPVAEVAYTTRKGTMYASTIEAFLKSEAAAKLAGKVNLIFTSPPFPLRRKKKYGNLNGDEYLQWLRDLAQPLTSLLRPDGSIVIEIGNAWEPGRPVMSTLPLRSFLAFLEAGHLQLCQQFVCHNPARLPTPIEWVNVRRIRVKDSFTHVWWMSPTDAPRASNRRVLTPYKPDMVRLLKAGKYNGGPRPSGHNIGAASFLTNNHGAIPPSVIEVSNTRAGDSYRTYCRQVGVKIHPAPMASELATFFIKLLTNRNDLVLDPFAGSNTTGATAELLQRRWVAVEPERDYVAGSWGRFSKGHEVQGHFPPPGSPTRARS